MWTPTTFILQWFHFILPVTVCVCLCMCRRVLPIHPNFRVVAVGEPEAKRREGSAAKSSWLNPEVLSMFHFHHVTPLPQDQEREVILKKVGLH